jgi:hypothetical protein
MNTLIRKAVELADGFEYRKSHEGDYINLPYIGFVKAGSNVALDALAAQLVRQVDALDGCEVICDPYCIKVFVAYKKGAKIAKGTAHEFDRAMNTIKAIVDSGVLK